MGRAQTARVEARPTPASPSRAATLPLPISPRPGTCRWLVASPPSPSSAPSSWGQSPSSPPPDAYLTARWRRSTSPDVAVRRGPSSSPARVAAIIEEQDEESGIFGEFDAWELGDAAAADVAPAPGSLDFGRAALPPLRFVRGTRDEPAARRASEPTPSPFDTWQHWRRNNLFAAAAPVPLETHDDADATTLR